MKTIQLITPETCREAMRQFWDGHSQFATTDRGVIMALPLMYPDGWQVHVSLETISATRAMITDRGHTLMRLHEQGINYNAGHAAELLNERKKTFELLQNGYELCREIRLPLDGLDVQLFAESLVSISHLIYRFESHVLSENAADRTLRKIFAERRLQPKEDFELDGAIERQIRVHYYIPGHHAIACHVVRRQAALLPYMEQWGFRWHDLRQKHRNILGGMVYDPDKQEWDSTALEIGRRVCDLFYPYYETQEINAFLDKAMSLN